MFAASMYPPAHIALARSHFVNYFGVPISSETRDRTIHKQNLNYLQKQIAKCRQRLNMKPQRSDAVCLIKALSSCRCFVTKRRGGACRHRCALRKIVTARILLSGQRVPDRCLRAARIDSSSRHNTGEPLCGAITLL